MMIYWNKEKKIFFFEDASVRLSSTSRMHESFDNLSIDFRNRSIASVAACEVPPMHLSFVNNPVTVALIYISLLFPSHPGRKSRLTVFQMRHRSSQT